MFMNGYKPNKDDGVNFAVFSHPNGDKNLPPAFLQVAGMDPLRDDAIIYERVLKEEHSINTKINVYPGVPHGDLESQRDVP
jgi:acetyl esterase/lipase